VNQWLTSFLSHAKPVSKLSNFRHGFIIYKVFMEA